MFCNHLRMEIKGIILYSCYNHVRHTQYIKLYYNGCVNIVYDRIYPARHVSYQMRCRHSSCQMEIHGHLVTAADVLRMILI